MPIGRREQKCGSSWSKTKKGDTRAIPSGVTAGAGRFTNPMRQTNKWPSTSRKTVWAVIFPQEIQIGSTSRVIPFLVRSKGCFRGADVRNQKETRNEKV